ncbi:MAG: HEAT repeat domain-containing protein [candidate division Zixibacteria bacterium]|nr:HEAT repeat domain-containing protein [candidate division Zixibacteria bacterium]
MERFLRRLAAAVVVILAAAVAYYVWDTFREKSTAEKLAEIIHDEDRRELSGRLETYLHCTDPEVRGRAALTVGRIGQKGSGKLLIDMVTDSSLDVASQAAFALGLTREKGYASQLMDMVPDVPSAVAMRLVEAAGRLADSTMYDVANQLVEALSHPSPDVREAACLALFRAGAKSKAAAVTEFVNGEEDALVQAAALYALSRFEANQAMPVFVRFLADADPFVRATAISGLSHIASPDAEHYLAIALNDSDPSVVAQAVAALGRKDNSEARTQLARKLEQVTDEKVMVALIEAMRRQENRDGLSAILAKLEVYPVPAVVAAGIKYLAVIRKDRSVNMIDSLAAQGEPYIRAACAEAYGLVGKSNVVPRLAVLFSDEDGMVRMAAFDALVRLDSTNVDFYLGKALADADYVVVTGTVEMIKQKRLAGYLPVLRTMMSRGEAIDVDIRRELVQAAGVFLAENPNDTAAMEILLDGILDPEYVVRVEAAEIHAGLPSGDRPGLASVAQTRISEGRIESALDKYATNPYATIHTDKGEIEMELFFDAAPLTVLNFIELAEDGFYEGLIFHRVVPGFVIQGGDPRGDGWGGPPYYIRCEYSWEPFRRGTVGVATSGKDTGGSQFFITLARQPHLEGRYTVFGQVVAGMDVVDRIAYGDVIQKVVIEETSK